MTATGEASTAANGHSMRGNAPTAVERIEDVELAALAMQVGTPAYVYSRAALERNFNAFEQALAGLPHLVCFAVKANSALGVLDVLARQGAGFDIVSGGELERVLRAGGDPTKVVFSGVGKSGVEIQRALDVGIRCFNVESAWELDHIAEIAASIGRSAPVSIRVNPDVDAETHPYIATGLRENKFGVDAETARTLYHKAERTPWLEIVGIDAHIGSQLTQLQPFVDALQRLLALIDLLAADGITLQHIDLGGGLGVRYRDETPPTPAEWAAAIRPLLADRALEIIIEPGRAIAANAGLLLTRVLGTKVHEDHRFAIVDAAMNDLIRPSLYGAWQRIDVVDPDPAHAEAVWDIVGPVCETGDFLGKQRPLRLAAGSLLAVHGAGAYGYTMASHYNTRPKPPEVMVDGGRIHVITRRESVDQLLAREARLPLHPAP